MAFFYYSRPDADVRWFS